MPLDLSVLLAKEEVTYGTFSSPAGATDAMLVYNLAITPMEAEEVRSPLERGFPGATLESYTRLRHRYTFEVELAGSGAAGTAPFWARLLRGCLIDASTPLTGPTRVQMPLGTAGDGGSLSIVGFKDNVRHRSRGARGNAVFRFADGAIPSLGFDVLGLFNDADPADAAAPGAITLPAPPVGVECSLINTVVQLGGFTLGVRSLEINLGMKTEFYSHTAARAVIFGKDEAGDRRAITGRAVFELPDPAVKSYFADIRNRTAQAFSLVHGLSAGNIVELTSARCFIGRMDYQVEQNRIFASCPLSFVPSSGGNELTILTR
jgi:hypothetical protein